MRKTGFLSEFLISFNQFHSVVADRSVVYEFSDVKSVERNPLHFRD